MFSVIVTSYKDDLSKTETLISILTQKQVDFEEEVEVIVVDAVGTTTFSDKVKVIKVGDISLPAARQMGVNEASGDWFVFMDAGDVMMTPISLRGAIDAVVGLEDVDQVNFAWENDFGGRSPFRSVYGTAFRKSFLTEKKIDFSIIENMECDLPMMCLFYLNGAKARNRLDIGFYFKTVETPSKNDLTDKEKAVALEDNLGILLQYATEKKLDIQPMRNVFLPILRGWFDAVLEGEFDKEHLEKVWQLKTLLY